MATVKKAMKKPMMKKSAPKRMAKPMPAPPMQAPPTASAPMGGGPMMKKGGKMKKYQNSGKPLSAKDSMNVYANQYDSLSASAAKKLTSDKKGAMKDIKSANTARGNEMRIAKKLYPNYKKGGKMKKK